MKKATIQQTATPDFLGNEAVNTICSNLLFAGRNLRKILITSYNAAEGKSFVAQQILWNLARRGKKSVLIDADLRRSNLTKNLGFATDAPVKGLAHYLAGYSAMEDTIYEINASLAHIIPIGRGVKNPITMLDLPQFAELLNTLAETFDVVLIDSPPLGIVIDAADIASNCDGAVIVAEYDRTRRRDLITARGLLEQTGCPILGCVINKFKREHFGANRYYHGYDYASDTTQP